MNRMAMILEIADKAAKLPAEDVHRFVMRALKRCSDADLFELDHEVDQLLVAKAS